MSRKDLSNEILQNLKKGNERFVSGFKDELKQHLWGQKPKAAILTCSDSRVVPEFIFSTSIGELFVVRIAGNIAVDPTVITSLEYAIEHLNIQLILIMGHTSCGAVKSTEETSFSNTDILLSEIKAGFSYDKDHVAGNVKRQVSMLTRRSVLISKMYSINKLLIKGAVFNMDTGIVKFL